MNLTTEVVNVNGGREFTIFFMNLKLFHSVPLILPIQSH